MIRKSAIPYIVSASLLGLAVLLVPQITHAADFGEAVAQFIGNIVAAIVWLLGKVLVLIIFLVVWVAQYNEFVTSPAVTVGWAVIRDVCNMFFIVILLIIAFCTILNIKSFQIKHALPKLLLAAILINFSKILCGFVIDVSQVFMLTFVNGFKDIAGGNFGEMFNISKLLNINYDSPDVSILGVAGTYILALGYIIISIVVISVILAILVLRIVMLWIYVVLSPLACLLSAVPGKLSKFAGKWVSDFTNHVVAGPLLAFFVWLAFATMQSSATPLGSTPKPDAGGEAQYQNAITNAGAEDTGNISAGLADAGTPDGMLKFVIAIAMLIGGLMITKEFSGGAGDIAGKGLSMLKKQGLGGLKAAGINTGKNIGQKALRTGGWATEKLGGQVGQWTGGRFGDSLDKSGKFLRSWGSDIKKTREEDKAKKREKTLKALGMKKDTMKHLDAAADTALGRTIKGVGLAAGSYLTGNPFIMTAGITAGLTHAGFAANKDHIAKGLKGAAVGMQKLENQAKANKRVKQLEDGMSDSFKDKEARQKQYKKSETLDKKALEGEWKEATIGKTQDEIDRINLAFEGKFKSIEERYKKLADKAEEDYQNTTPDSVKRNDDVLKPHLDEARQAQIDASHDSSLGRTRRKEYKEANRMEKQELADLKTVHEAAVEDANNRYTGKARQVKVAELKDNYKAERDRISKQYQVKRDQADNTYQAGNDNVKLTSFDAQRMNAIGGAVEKYKPNRVTRDAAGKAVKDYKVAHERIRQLNDPSEVFTRFHRDAWSSGEGINGQQHEMYHAMASGKDPHAHEALERLEEWMNEIQRQGIGMRKDIAERVDSLKKGIAHYTHEKPMDHDAFHHLIQALDKIDTGHKNKTVHDWAPHEAHEEHEDHGHKLMDSDGDDDHDDHGHGGHH